MLNRFELNELNGQFIGLYLADGHTCHSAGAVGISKNDKGVQEFARKWFEMHGFTARLQENTNDRGTSFTMYGNSLLLARFIDAFVGKGSHGKFVPDVAFAAPDAFVVGLLSGYFSGDGTIERGAVSSSSVSERLNEGIATLCNRLGAFGKISTLLVENHLRPVIAPVYRLSVRAQWAQVLAKKLHLIHPEKKDALAAMVFTDVHRRYAEQEDCVRDPIVSIEVIGAETHPKLYDVTVPSTLRFTLANGLNTFDTSETGYLQRRLVKAMEDCKIHHDLTVRNANNFIVQFLYGEDGMDAVKLEFHAPPTVGRSPAELRDDFLIVDAAAELAGHLTPAAMAASRLPAQAQVCEAHFRQLLDDRREVIMGLHGGLEIDLNVVYPVNVRRIVEMTAELQRDAAPPGSEPLSDLDPAWVVERIEALAAELRIGGEDTGAGVRWMPLLLRCFLSPKTLIRKHRLTKASFERVAAQVRRDFLDAVASPGEMTGIVAAQSIGEPATQLSGPKDMRVQVYRGANDVYDGPIGELVDGIMAADPMRVVDLGGGSTVLDPTDAIYIVGVSSDDEKTNWRRISQVSRHPANGGMVRIKTRSGRTTSATLSHSFLKRAERGIVPVLGSDLVIGDRVPVARFVPTVAEPIVHVLVGATAVGLSPDFGWLLGTYVADGNVCRNNTISISKVIPEFQDKLRQVYSDIFGLEMRQSHKPVGVAGNILHGWDMSKYPGTSNRVSNADLSRFLLDAFGTGSFVKRLPAWMYAADLDFVKGFICGYFDGDGNVHGDGPKSMIRSASVSEKLTEDVILLLTRVGIFASKCREKHIAEPDRNDLHTIQISRKYARRFRDEVGPMVVKHKAESLESIIAYVDRKDAHCSQEFIDKIPELGGLLAATGKALRMPGQSRLYGRFLKKESIGRETLRGYVGEFEATLEARYVEAQEQRAEFAGKFERMRAVIAAARATPKAVDHRGVMDAPEDLLRELCDARTRLLGNKALGAANLVTNARNGRITASLFASHVDKLDVAADACLTTELAALDDVRDDKLPALNRALHADVVWDEIVEIERLPDPGEMVYDFTVPGNDSFMVDCGVLVHNTLNSVVHGTELLMGGMLPPSPPCPGGEPPCPPHRRLFRTTIGDLVDARIEAAEAADRELGIESDAKDVIRAEIAAPGGEDRDDEPLHILHACKSLCVSPLVVLGGDEVARRHRRLERHPNDTTLLWLKDGGDDGPVHSGIEVMSVDEDGAVSWKEVTAVTRHPVVNKDGSDTLIEVTTESGRSVVATKGKSFLTRRSNKLVATDGEDLRVGDYLPVTRVLPLLAGEILTHLEVDRYLPRSEYMYEGELRKAATLRETDKYWWGKRGSAFELPHQRGDSVLVCARLNAAAAPDRKFREGCVYPKKLGPFSGGHFPERIPLDNLFGFYCGAYLAEGSEGNSQVHISNVDKDYQARVIEFAERYDIKWHLADNSTDRGRSEDVCLHSKVLSDMTIAMFGRRAENKRIPAELIAANTDFLKGLVDGYFSGDGAISATSWIIEAASVSRGLIEDVSNVLTRFNIFTKMRTYVDKRASVNVGGAPIQPCHYMYARNGDAARFVDTFKFTKVAKQASLNNMRNITMRERSDHTPEDVVPSLVLPGSDTTLESIHRDALPKLLATLSDAADRAAVETAMASDVWYDKVIAITEVPNPKRYVYDLTIKDTRTFAIYNGIYSFDTFHLSGSSLSSKVTSGVPRMKELMSMSKNVKTPAMKVALRREWATSQEKAQAVLSSIETTNFRDLVKRSSVHFDPESADGGSTAVAEDAGMMAFYREFGAQEASRVACDARASPWLLRFEFDRMKMLDLSVTMLDLEATLVDFYDDTVACLLSDDNAAKLVCRMRLAQLPADSGDLLTEVKALEQSIMDTVVVKGIKGIDKAIPVRPQTVPRYDSSADAFVPGDEWSILTAGSNMIDVMGHPCVDYARTCTNDVYEIYLVLGIEAARQVLINELRNVLGNSTSVDHRHLALLADTMSNRGFFMSIDRHGINNRGELGPLAKCSFEQTTDMLIKAGVFAERDRINGVSANIMLGQVAPCGTGDCEVLMDGKALVAFGTRIEFEDAAMQPSSDKGAAAAADGEDVAMLPEFATQDDEKNGAAGDAGDADAAGDAGEETKAASSKIKPKRRAADQLVIE
jgi:intein/homing endonuclease